MFRLSEHLKKKKNNNNNNNNNGIRLFSQLHLIPSWLMGSIILLLSNIVSPTLYAPTMTQTGMLANCNQTSGS
jgi:hypothetical protein